MLKSYNNNNNEFADMTFENKECQIPIFLYAITGAAPPSPWNGGSFRRSQLPFCASPASLGSVLYCSTRLSGWLAASSSCSTYSHVDCRHTHWAMHFIYTSTVAHTMHICLPSRRHTCSSGSHDPPTGMAQNQQQQQQRRCRWEQPEHLDEPIIDTSEFHPHS